MCGLAGVVHPAPDMLRPEHVGRMLDAMRHRGPDDRGLLSEAPDLANGRPGATLGHCRLSIIDLSPRGRQPMANEDGAIQVCFNGEIYNFLELRRKLAAAGHAFASDTDTETIVHGYEEWGRGVLERLEGMFALAVWDGRERSLLLARDRFGEKPLYYAGDGSGLAFASELKALVCHPLVRRDIDPAGVARFLFYEYVPAPRTIFAGVSKLEPGSWLEFAGGRLSRGRYWRMSFAASGPAPQPEAAADGVLSRLDAAVAGRLVSDVPLGVFLSGGVDSSAVLAMACRHRDPAALDTFSIGFDEPSFDESGWARRVAGHFGVRHHERRLRAADLPGLLDTVWGMLDEPMADPSIVPTYLLCRFAREHVTVALGGDGGDELFCGYDPFAAQALAGWLEMLPGAFRRRVLEPLAGLLPVSFANMSLDFKVKRLLSGLGYAPALRNLVWMSALAPDQVARLLNGNRGAMPDIPAEVEGMAGEHTFRDATDQAVFVFAGLYLPHSILAKVDTASMAVSLEVRAPFLDTGLAEYALGLPGRLKVRGMARKLVLKQALRGLVPDFVLRRAKKGFGMPVAEWLCGPLRPEITDPAFVRDLAGLGLDPAPVKSLVDEHLARRRDHRKALWSLLTLARWQRLSPAAAA